MVWLVLGIALGAFYGWLWAACVLASDADERSMIEWERQMAEWRGDFK